MLFVFGGKLSVANSGLDVCHGIVIRETEVTEGNATWWSIFIAIGR